LDLVLIRRCQAGDDEAFGLLFEEYKNLVYRTVYLTLGSTVEAEDLLQEVFLQVHRSLDAYDPKRGAFSTWLYRITVNVCLNWRRRRPSTQSLEELADEPAEDSQPFAEGFAQDDCVRRALHKLSRKLRVVVVLRHYLDLSYAEIAQITDLPLGTVKSRLNLALRLLRDDLECDFPSLAQSAAEVQR
jgi:RNA polymerase sigma-70 factor (ECF subfamily)